MKPKNKKQEIEATIKPEEYMGGIHPELKDVYSELKECAEEVLKINCNESNKWKNSLKLANSRSILAVLNTYTWIIDQASGYKKYSHLINEDILEKADDTQEYIRYLRENQLNTKYTPKEQKLNFLDGLNLDLAGYEENDVFKNVIHYHYKNNGKTQDSTLIIRDDELNDLLESVEAYNSKTEILETCQEKTKLSLSDIEVLKRIEFYGIIPKLALTPQNHEQMLDENLIHYENGSLFFTDIGYTMFQKVNELFNKS